ncbi:MAG: hypothetical protein U5N85_09170 [Arcicella sp.]|nr:hypothetical protein [Arcicella sp.]
MKNKSTYFGWAFIALPIILYFYFLSEYSLNIPKWDDHALKSFILEFENANGFLAKSQTFFRQHNEHRIAFDRLITLLVFKVYGTIDYRWLMWVGNFTLIGTLIIFIKIFQKQKLPLWYFVPVSLIFFQLQLWENTFWGMAALQNFGIIFFIFGLIYLVCSEKKSHFYWSILFAFFATYTSGNGITVFPVCLVLLILQRRFKESIIFGIVSVALIGAYFYQYQMPPSNPPMEGIGFKKVIFGFFSFIGSAFDLMPNSSGRIKLTIIAGGILFMISALITIYLIFNSKLLKKNRILSYTELFALGSIMFLIGTAIVVTFTRISFGELGLLTSRYKIYSILLSITLYLFIISKIELTNLKWLDFPLILIALGFNLIANYMNFKEVVNFRNQLISFAINWKLQPEANTVKSNIVLYETPKFELDRSISSIRESLKLSPILQENLTKTVRGDGILLQNNKIQNQESVFFVVQSPNKTYLMPSLLVNYPINAFVKTGKYWQNGFEGEFNYNEFENGTYQLGLLTNDGKSINIYYLNDSLIVNNTKPRNVKTNW